MKKTGKKIKAASIVDTKASNVLTDSFPKGEDVSLHWPELGNKGVVVGDIKMPEPTIDEDYTAAMFSSEKIVTGGIFVNVGEQQIWPIRYSADSVNVRPFLPGESILLGKR